MGYTTEFQGKFLCSPALTPEQVLQLKEFADTRHENNSAPSYYCQWIPTRDGSAVVWDGVEKFYEYTAWLKLLIQKFFKPWDITLNGEVEFQGEDSCDQGTLVVKNNRVSIR